MEPESYMDSPHYDSDQRVDQHQARVDPRYPLHYQTGRDGQANGQTIVGDDSTRRTNSRRRKPSGSAGSAVPVPAPMPEAPDVPRSSRSGPPISFRDPYAEEPMPTDTSRRSFSERASTQPNAFDASFATYKGPEPQDSPDQRRHSRRVSTGHEVPYTYPKSKKQKEGNYTSRPEPESAQPVAQVPRSKPVLQDSQQTQRSGESEERRASNSQPRRSNTMRSSTGEPSDWAAERSPLQRLEVKLNDISKEEKRARVMQAEAKLRGSRSGDTSRRVSEAVEPGPSRSASKRISSADTQRRSSQGTGQTNSRGVSGYTDPTSPAAGRHESTRSSGAEPRRSISGASTGKLRKPPPPEFAERQVDQQRRRSIDIDAGDRAVRFHGPRGTLQNVPADGRQGQPATQMNPLLNERMRSDTGGEKADEQPDVVPREAVVTGGIGPKYRVPPQTAAGVDARQKIGFGDRREEPTDTAQPRSHYFSNILPRRREQPQPVVNQGPPRHLDEWRQGQTAHLTLADANAPAVETPKPTKQNAWWESPRSGSQRRRSSAQADYTALDGAQEDSNGKNSPVSSDVGSSTSFSTFLRRRARRGHLDHEEDFDSQAHPYIHHGNRAWVGFRRSGQPSSVATSINSGTTVFSSAHSLPSEGPPSPLPYDYLRHLLAHIRDPFTLHRKLTKRLSTLAVPQVFTPPLFLRCGPLLRYTGLRREKKEESVDGTPLYKRETWRGSVMIVTDDSQSEYKPAPTLRIFHQPMNLLPPPPQQYDGSKEEELQSEYVDPIAGLPKMNRTGGTVYVKPAEDLEVGKDVSTVEDDDGLYEETRTANVPTSYGKADELLGRTTSTSSKGKYRPLGKLGRYKEVKGVRLHAERGLTFWRFSIEVELGEKETRIAYRINQGTSIGFWVPARGQAMHIMFHSCNGFSRSVDSNEFSGPDPLWRDVLNGHQLKPFHVMLGGGDQIYNDKVMDECELFGQWLDHKNPHHKHEQEFSADLQDELESFYLNRYCTWFSQGLFGMASSQIPMVNIWDDHDIIDGFGSYSHHFMSSKVFSGLGNVAFKYYMLFQHQSVVNEEEADESSWVLGASPGPYINELNRSVFMSLGGGLAFLGVDCRTERTRDEVLSEASYNLIFDRCNREIVRGETKHLIVLLGVPIAYPRLVWLENILTSRALDPFKALGRMGLLGNTMNKFDGGVEILDDLDDHWTAKNHKEERNWFIEELQHMAAGKSIRITILGGDVHLAAVGQFYSNRALGIRKDKDFRYMPNIISSAIVNTPPPDMLADVLNKRNKIHHLNEHTDEDMIPMFTHDVDGKPRNNKRLLPRRNWCSITEYIPGSTPPSTPSTMTPTASEESLPQPPKPPGAIQRTLSLGRNDSKPAKLIRRLSLSNREPESYVDRSPSPPVREPQMVSVPIPIRPVSQFHRRPTNLSVKAAAKGGGEHDDHVNLEHGLDIKLNVEIKKGDPSGSTESYRLLVPALFFDGEDEEPHRSRKQSLIQRFNSRRRSKAGARQGGGNWGQSESESDAEERPRTSDYFEARPRVSSQQAPGLSSPLQSPGEVPKRSVSLLQKRPPPFKFRPKPNDPERDTSPRQRPPISAPIPQTQSPSTLKSPPFRQNPTTPLGMDGEDDYSSEDEELYPPTQRRGAGKILGFSNDHLQESYYPPPANGGGGAFGSLKARMGLGRSNSLPVQNTGRRGSAGYDGIEAYKEKKGWRKFL